MLKGPGETWGLPDQGCTEVSPLKLPSLLIVFLDMTSIRWKPLVVYFKTYIE